MEKGTIVKLMQEFNVHLYKIKENEKFLDLLDEEAERT